LVYVSLDRPLAYETPRIYSEEDVKGHDRIA